MNNWINLKTLRIALYVAIFLVASLLFFRWQLINMQVSEQQAQLAAQNQKANAVSGAPNLSLGSNAASTTSANTGVTENAMPSLSTDGNATSSVSMQQGLITIDAPLYLLKIDPHGGNIVYAELKQYKQMLGAAAPFVLLNNNPNALYYTVQSGLVTSDKTIPDTIPFSSAQTYYSLSPHAPLAVELSWISPSKVSVTKIYTFYPNTYTVNVNYVLKNQSGAPLDARFYGELSRMPPNEPSAFWNSYTNYTGAAISYPDNHYQKLKFGVLAENNLNQSVSSGWVAMLQHYFITAWIPSVNQAQTQFSNVSNNVYSIGLANPNVNVASGGNATTGATLYLGPAIASQLKQIAPYLDKTVDYGWLWFISELIFQVMQWIYHYVGNWGVAIILVTVLIKLLFYPLSSKSYRSMARMRELQPKILALREKFGTDRQKLGVATMELYRKEKVNPVGGCLPILIQIPVFIALYWVIMESVELRQAPFFGWIHDLSVRDPYFILPVLMGLSMLVQQKISPKPADAMQAKMMMILPVVFTLMFLGFPSGLVLYWLVNNCLSVLQQWWIMRRVMKKDGFIKKAKSV